MSVTRVGLIGAGLMGQGIGKSLLRHGHALTVLEHAGNQPLAPLKEAGARSEKDPSVLVREIDVLILCVTGSAQVEAIMLGDEGLAASLKAGTVVIDCSTAIPESTVRIAAAVQDAGGRFLDAAMTRTPKEAAEGRLNLLVGADGALFDEMRPLLECFAESISHCGPVGAGHRFKLLHNYVSLGQMALLSEAFACAERAGADTTLLGEILANGGGSGAALNRIRPYVESGDASAVLFSMANACKDLGYYTAMANAEGAAQGIAAAALEAYELAKQANADAPVPELFARLLGR